LTRDTARSTGTGGYAQRGYATALAEFGRPVRLPGSEGWLLERPIADSGLSDLMSPYPLFACADWSRLASDLDALESAAVSVVCVADPLADVGTDLLRAAFRDHVVPYKAHLVRDLAGTRALPSSHRRQLRRAGRAVEVELLEDPVRRLDEWIVLYAGLVARHGLTGVRAFSPESFRRQLSLPGMVALRADRDGATVAMTLWLVDGERGYYHLGASSDAGREVSASYALFAAAFEHLAALGVRHVDLGGVAGDASREDGLSRFKRGWADVERTAYLCGRILDRVAWARLTAAGSGAAGWFPAYRAGEQDMAGGSAPSALERGA
jgi:hypothetical protein